MSLLKGEYQALLNLLHRVEVKGIQEAQSLIILAQKLEKKIADFVDPTPPAPAVVSNNQAAGITAEVVNTPA